MTNLENKWQRLKYWHKGAILGVLPIFIFVILDLLMFKGEILFNIDGLVLAVIFLLIGALSGYMYEIETKIAEKIFQQELDTPKNYVTLFLATITPLVAFIYLQIKFNIVGPHTFWILNIILIINAILFWIAIKKTKHKVKGK